MISFRKLGNALVFAFVGFLGVSAAQGAVYYQFEGVTENNPTDLEKAVQQIYVEIFAGETVNIGTEDEPVWQEHVNFRFHNVGSYACFIADVYFEDGTLLASDYTAEITVSDPELVAFSSPANPGSLPGGETIGFDMTGGFSADSDSPVAPNGVNNHPSDLEWVNFDFGLINEKTFQTVILDLANGDLRIGVHVQGFAGGNSESLILEPGTCSDEPPVGSGPPQVPEPTALAIWGAVAGLGLMIGRQRQKRLG